MVTPSENVWICLVIVVVAFLVLLPFSVIGVDVHHDGIMLKPAVDVAEGQMLHRDTFSQYGPLTTLTHAALLNVFGKKLIVLRVATALMYSLSLGALFLTWRMILPMSLCLVSVCIWFCLVPFYRPGWHILPWSSSEALLIQSVCLWLMTVAQSQRKAASAFLLITGVGALASAVFWCRQPVGGLLAISGASIPVFLQLQFQGQAVGLKPSLVHFVIRNRFLWGYVIGGVLPALLMLTWLYYNDALIPWYEQNILWPRVFASGYFSLRSVYQCFGTTQIIIPCCMLVVLLLLPALLRKLNVGKRWGVCAVAAIGAFWCVFVHFRPQILTLTIIEKSIPIMTVGLVSLLALRREWSIVLLACRLGLLFPVLASWSQYYPVPCIRHMFWGVCPALGLFVFLLSHTLNANYRQIAVAILMLFMPLVAQRISEASDHLRWAGDEIRDVEMLAGMRPYRSPVSGVELLRGFEADFDWFASLCRRLRRDFERTPLIVNGDDALFALLSVDKRNPGPFYVTWSQLDMFGLWDARSEFIREHRPLILVECEIGVVQDFTAYLRQGYEQEFLGVAFGKDMYLLVPSAARLPN
ncbi:MAG: hypothetical protein WCK86_17060 [Planctomycetia bacterium]